MAKHAEFAPFIPDVIGRFGYCPMGEPEPVRGGSLNWNFRVPSDGGAWFVRRYRDDADMSRIRGEHALVRWAEELGIPAPVPEATPDDLTIVELAGGRWALFPWVDGEVRARGSLDAGAAHTLGALHGYSHAVLARHPDSTAAHWTKTWDKPTSVATLAKLIDSASLREADDGLQDGLRLQASMLEALDVRPPADFTALPAQVLHGDFHDQQVIWQDGNIQSLGDWEMWHTGPRIWELLRSLAFSRMLDSANLEPYLEGYRAFVQLSEDECRLGLHLWWQSRIVGTWLWSAYLSEGNERVAEHLPGALETLQCMATPGYTEEIDARFLAAALS